MSKFDQTGRESKRKKKEREEREKKGKGERGSSFSLDFPTIGLSVRVGARGKVGSRIEIYAWVPKTVGFVKLREVGVLLLLGLFSV